MIYEQEVRTLEVDNKNIGMFEQTDYRRMLRNSMVNRLKRYLVDEGGFRAPIHLNKKGEKYRVVDGNHRFEAIKKFLENNPSEKVSVPIAVYHNLNEIQEKELYDILAKTVNQSMSDFLKIHYDEVPIFEMVCNKFPIQISIYSSQTGLRLSTLLKVWFSRSDAILTIYDKDDVLEKAKALAKKDYIDLASFFGLYKEVFGDPSAQSVYYKVAPLWITASIYFRNRALVPDSKLVVLFKEKLFNNVLLLQCAKYAAREPISDFRRMILDKLNAGWRGTKLV